MRIQKGIEKIELEAGERIVSAVFFEGYIVVITDRGTIYKVQPESR